MDLVCQKRAKKESAHSQPLRSQGDPTAGQEFLHNLQEEESPMNSDPLLWWTVNGKKYPRLSKLAKRLLCVPASSTASEQSFSTSGHIAEQQRASLTSANINMLVVLNKNWRLVGNVGRPMQPPQVACPAIKASSSEEEDESSSESDELVLSLL